VVSPRRNLIDPIRFRGDRRDQSQPRADVDFWTSREPREVVHCHLNYVVPDTAKWGQQAAYYIDKHPLVDAFVKNAGLGFAIPYLHNGQMHDYMPDFIVRLKTSPPIHVIVETKGFDPLGDVKRAAAERWVAAVNADGGYGRWSYGMARKTTEVSAIITSAATGDFTGPSSALRRASKGRQLYPIALPFVDWR